MGDVSADLGCVSDLSRRSLRILLVSPYDFATPGGVTEHVTQLDRALRLAGHRTRIIAPLSNRPGFTPPESLVSAGPVISVPANGAVARINLSLRLNGLVRKTLSDFQPEIVHIHEPFMPLLPFVAMRHSVGATVVTFHANSGNELGYRYGRRLIEHYFARVNGRIAVSPAAASFVSRHFPGTYVVIPNGVDVARFQCAEPFPYLRDGLVNLLFVGRLEERKGFDILARSFVRLRRRHLAVRLIVVGAYEVEQAARHKKKLDAVGETAVTFVGYATPDLLARYYASSDVVCAPSLGGESFGLVLLEGMAAGKPIVASRIPGYRDVVEDGIEGLLVAPGDIDSLTSALESTVRDQRWRDQLGQRGKRKAQLYSWTRIGAQVADFYRETLAERASIDRPYNSSACSAELAASNPAGKSLG